MIPINVWYYNDLLSEWILKGTQDYQETKDEYKYFRVMSSGMKLFYASAEDYFEHNKKKISPITEHGNYNVIQFTNLKDEVIYNK
jgi:hypothetical protein